jgi:hypothetical protein
VGEVFLGIVGEVFLKIVGEASLGIVDETSLGITSSSFGKERRWPKLEKKKIN